MTARLSVGLELKALSDREFEGHGSVFKNVDLGGDIMLPGAFKRSLAQHKADGTMPAMFWMHQPDKVAGVWHEMREDSKGLYVRGELAKTALGDEMRELLKMKAVRGLSVGYRTMDADYDADGNRLLKEVWLGEVSLVSLAMNPLAQVSAMKAARLTDSGEYVPTSREFERCLRDAGMSRKAAKQIISRLGGDYDGEDDELPCGMLGADGRLEAGGVEQDETAILKSLEALTTKLARAAFNPTKG